MGRSLYGIITSVAISIPVEATKMYHKKVKKDEALRNQIMQEGLYHFTSEKGVDAILSSGYIKPSGIMQSHLTRPKSYMFCGIPTIDVLRKNMPSDKNPFLNEVYEFDAVYIKPNEENIKDLKVRHLNDNAIVKDGKFILPENKIEYIQAEDKLMQQGAFNQKLVINLDENGNLILENFDINKHQYEIIQDENGSNFVKYKPSEELKELLEKEREKNSNLKENFNQLDIEKKTFISKMKEIFGKIFRDKNDIKMLNTTDEKLEQLGYNSVEEMNQDDPDITILDNELSNLVNTPEEILSSQEKRELIEEMESKEQEISDMYK